MKKIAVITGASSGMGRRFAETVQEFGTYDEIWAIARRVDRLEELKNHTSFPVRTISLDLSDPASYETYAALLREEQPEVVVRLHSGTGANCAESTGTHVASHHRRVDSRFWQDSQS